MLQNFSEFKRFFFLENGGEDNMGRPCGMNGRDKNNIRALIVGSKGRRSLGRSGRRWKSTVEIDRKGIACECVGWIKLAQDRINNRLL
jgi:hypothetical protein